MTLMLLSTESHLVIYHTSDEKNPFILQPLSEIRNNCSILKSNSKLLLSYIISLLNTSFEKGVSSSFNHSTSLAS